MTISLEVAKQMEEASINKNLAGFYRAHRKEGIFSCEANDSLIRTTANRLVLDLTNPETYEVCLLALGDRLARRQEEPKPAPVVEPPPSRKPLSEMDESELRQCSREDLKAYVHSETSRIQVEKRTLPQTWETVKGVTIELTPVGIQKMPGPEMRRLMETYGSAAIDARLQGRE